MGEQDRRQSVHFPFPIMQSGFCLASRAYGRLDKAGNMGRAEELVGWSSGRGTESSGLAKCALTAFGRLASWLACLCYRCLQSLGSPLFPSIQEIVARNVHHSPGCRRSDHALQNSTTNKCRCVLMQSCTASLTPQGWGTRYARLVVLWSAPTHCK